MKVVVVTDSLSRAAGGLFESVRRLAQEMHQIGFKVQVFGVGDKWVNEDLQKWRPLEPRVFPCRGPQSFGYAPGLVEAIKAERPITMQIHGIWQYASIAVLRASTAMGCPYVVNLHGMLDPWAVRNSRWKKCLAAWAYERRHLQGAACLRALCRSEVNAIRAYGLRNPVCIVPNAIDLPQETSANRSLQSPFPADRRVLLYLGRIHPKKNLLNLLEAWSLVQKSRVGGQRSDEWLLAIAGWDQGGYERQLKRRAAELEIGGRVAFLGPRFGDEKQSCYRHCDGFVLPSMSEGLPMVILEAWAYGKPALMTAECNLPEGFAAGAAIQVETSAGGIAAGLRTLMEMSAAERKEIGCRGLSLVKARYAWPEVARQMGAVQSWVSERGSVPACVEFA